MTKKLKLAVFAGHGGVDSGAVGNGYHEDDLALDIMKRTTKVLRNAGHTVINNRTADVNRNISADAKLANREKVDAVIEFHFDAAGASAEGTTGFYCATSSSSKKLAQCVNDKLDDVFKDRNVKPDTSTRHGRLGILRETNAVATLQEVAFITNKNDVAKYNAKADEVARKVVEGISSYFGQKLPATKSSSASKAASSTSSNKNSYYTENPQKIKTLVQCDLYNSVDFTEKHKTGGTFPKGTVFTTVGTAKTKGGTPRLKTKSGYFITANKKFVKKI
ncbi:N-acetylmuramoyl-L-alanine amidase [Listeria seeligeri]|uniref:N-acetylmuramoyl-L-alanine amidase n=1 Tax=Listeria seeligeri TaxID=1640 RepID=UPI0001C4EC41|nr:cell wall hydrolase/autolysin family protein [Listeria seeligeri serovar 1/2b str. SLCC3954]